MSILRRIAAFILPTLPEFHIGEQHFHSEGDPHLQWMETQRRESERKVREHGEQLPTGNVIEDELFPHRVPRGSRP